MPQEINVRDAVQFFGGPSELVRRLTAMGDSITVKAIEKWNERGQIPGMWLVAMSALAKTEGRLFDIHDFIRHTSDTPPNCN